MTASAARIFAAAEFEYPQFFTAHLRQNFGPHARAGDDRRADGNAAFALNEQNIAEGDFVAVRARQFFHCESVADFHPILLAAGADSRMHFLIIHQFSPPPKKSRKIKRFSAANRADKMRKAAASPQKKIPAKPVRRGALAQRVGVVMGSRSDWAVMRRATETLDEFGVAFESSVVSAHRTPDRLFQYAENARARNLFCIIAGAGGAAHLPGMLAAKTTLPILGVPIAASALDGLDSLLSIAQMPKGVPVATFAVGESGAINAALFAVAIAAAGDEKIRRRLDEFRIRQTQTILSDCDIESGGEK